MSSETTGTTIATIAPELQIIDGHVTTTSTQVAQHFNKRHDRVIRAIRDLLEKLPVERRPIFGETSIDVLQPNGGTRSETAYRMNRDGFTLLAMGFTGKEALQWKLAYIDAFNKMESALLDQHPTVASPYITQAQAQHLRELVQLVVDSGKQGHGETWNRLHRKMKVTSYKMLPPDKFDDAVAYLQGKLDDQSMAALVQKHFPDAVKALPAPEQKQEGMEFSFLSLKNKRLLLSYDHNGKELIQRVPNEAMLVTWQEVAHILREHYLMVSLPQITEIINAGCDAIVKRMQGKMIAA